MKRPVEIRTGRARRDQHVPGKGTDVRAWISVFQNTKKRAEKVPKADLGVVILRWRVGVRAFCCRFSARIKISRPPAADSAAAVIDLFDFSAGAWRLQNSALRASPKILLFALSEL